MGLDIVNKSRLKRALEGFKSKSDNIYSSKLNETHDLVLPRQTPAKGKGSAQLLSIKGNTFVQYEHIVSVARDARIKTTGINLWDEQWEVGNIGSSGEYRPSNENIRPKNLISVIGGKTYCYSSSAIAWLCLYDVNKTFIRGWNIQPNTTFEVPNNCAFLAFVPWYEPPYKNDICINISDPAINGQYFPYEGHELNLGIDLIVNSDGNPLFPDGLNGIGNIHDEMTPTKAVKRFGVKVFDGTENWVEDNNHYFSITIEDKKEDQYQYVLNNYYPTRNSWAADDKPKSVANVNQSYRFYDQTIGSMAEWKSYLADLYAQGNPLKVVYELAEPIEVTTDSDLSFTYTEGGMEMLVSDGMSATPTGTVTYYHDVQYHDDWRLTAKTFLGNLFADFVKLGRATMTFKDNLVNFSHGIEVKSIKIGKAVISWDEENDGLHIDKGVASESYISAGGVNNKAADTGVNSYMENIHISEQEYQQAEMEYGYYQITKQNPFGTDAILVQVYSTDGGNAVVAEVAVSGNNIILTFFSWGNYRMVIMG